MISNLLIALALMAICVVVHALGIIVIYHWVRRRVSRGARGFGPSAWRLVRVASLTVLLHLSQILAWTIYYRLSGALADFTTAAYFSAVTYTTTGYGDVVLPEQWRLLGGVEALTGILMCGLSTGMFFAVFSEMFGLKRRNVPAVESVTSA